MEEESVVGDKAAVAAAPEETPIGLVNGSSCCYINSVMQCLFWMDPACRWIRTFLPSATESEAVCRAYAASSSSSSSASGEDRWVVFVGRELVVTIVWLTRQTLAPGSGPCGDLVRPEIAGRREEDLLGGWAAVHRGRVVATCGRDDFNQQWVCGIPLNASRLTLGHVCFHAARLTSEGKVTDAMQHLAEHPWVTGVKNYARLLQVNRDRAAEARLPQLATAPLAAVNTFRLRSSLFGGPPYHHEDAYDALGGLFAFLPRIHLFPVCETKLLEPLDDARFPEEDVAQRTPVEPGNLLTRHQPEWSIRVPVPDTHDSAPGHPVSLDRLLRRVRYYHYAAGDAPELKCVDPCEGVVRMYRVVGEKVEWRGRVPPSQLVVQMKRFNYLGKIDTPVDVPLECDFARHFWRPKANPEKATRQCGGAARRQTDASFQYRLVGFIVHQGQLEGGHYTAYVDSRAGAASAETEATWFHCNDEVVLRVDPLSPRFQSDKNACYIAFYKRYAR